MYLKPTIDNRFCIKQIIMIDKHAKYYCEDLLYFNTPTFDRITKDRAAKFADMLSAIGGTMGLLTGFSIISAMP